MNTVLISPEYQVTLPVKVRKSLGIEPGQRVQVIQYDNRVELIPLRPMQAARGMLRGMNTFVARETESG